MQVRISKILIFKILRFFLRGTAYLSWNESNDMHKWVAVVPVGLAAEGRRKNTDMLLVYHLVCHLGQTSRGLIVMTNERW